MVGSERRPGSIQRPDATRRRAVRGMLIVATAPRPARTRRTRGKEPSMATVETEIVEAQQFIGGEWVPPRAARPSRTSTRSPATSSRGSPAGTRDDAQKAIEAAAAAFRGLVGRRRRPSGSGSSSRPPTCSRAAQRRGRLAARARDRRHVRLRRCSRCTSSRACSARRPRSPTRRWARSSRRTPARSRWASASPVGVVGAIAPWNAALILSARSIAAPLALGNTVVLKPSELSPYVGGLLWGEIFAEAGLPAGRAEHRHARARRRRRRSATSWSRTPPCAGSTSPARRRPAACSPRPRARN